MSTGRLYGRRRLERQRKWVVIALLTAAILLCEFPLYSLFADPAIHAGSLQNLDDKKTVVTTLSAITAGAATALAAVPDDSTTPVADQLAELAGYSFIISLIILIEKYILVLSGMLSFRFIFPASFLLLIAYFGGSKPMFMRMGLRLMLLGLCLMLMIPVSLSLDGFIDATFDTSRSVRVVMHEEKILDEAELTEETENASIFEAAGKFFSDLFNRATHLGEEAIQLFNNFVDAFVALTVKNFVVPVLTFLLLYSVSKYLLFSVFDQMNQERAIDAALRRERLPEQNRRENDFGGHA